ncbi:MAG TPA: hypothetical protein VEW94_11410, partial [Chloroflexia bacterium]|nr:hypothetical protein [Chloroflexia bacterium]
GIAVTVGVVLSELAGMRSQAANRQSKANMDDMMQVALVLGSLIMPDLLPLLTLTRYVPLAQVCLSG